MNTQDQRITEGHTEGKPGVWEPFEGPLWHRIAADLEAEQGKGIDAGWKQAEKYRRLLADFLKAYDHWMLKDAGGSQFRRLHARVEKALEVKRDGTE